MTVYQLMQSSISYQVKDPMIMGDVRPYSFRKQPSIWVEVGCVPIYPRESSSSAFIGVPVSTVCGRTGYSSGRHTRHPLDLR